MKDENDMVNFNSVWSINYLFDPSCNKDKLRRKLLCSLWKLRIENCNRFALASHNSLMSYYEQNYYMTNIEIGSKKHILTDSIVSSPKSVEYSDVIETLTVLILKEQEDA